MYTWLPTCFCTCSCTITHKHNTQIHAHMHTQKISIHFWEQQNSKWTNENTIILQAEQMHNLKLCTSPKWTIPVRWLVMKMGRERPPPFSQRMAVIGHVSFMLKYPGTWHFQDPSKACCLCSLGIIFCSSLVGRRGRGLHCWTKFSARGWAESQWHYRSHSRDDSPISKLWMYARPQIFAHVDLKGLTKRISI